MRGLWWLDNLTAFDGDAGATSGGGTGETPPPSTPTGSGNAGGTPDAKFTQADLDRLIDDRLKRERAKYADHDDLKKKAAEYDKLQDAQRTETERLAAERDRAKDEAAAKDAQIQAANERVIRAEVRLAAQSAGFIDPEDAWALIDRTKVALDDAGSVTGAAEAIKALAEKKPHLVGQGGERPNYGAPTPGRTNGQAPNDAVRKQHEQLAAQSGRYIPL